MKKNKQTILIIDDSIDTVKILDEILHNDYYIKIATNGKNALEIALNNKDIKLILLDINLPDTNGFELCKTLKENQCTKNIPVIFVTSQDDDSDEKKGFEIGAVDYITKPVSPSIVYSRVKTHIALFDQNQELELKVQKRTKELVKTRLEIIRRLGVAAEYKDNETGLHVIRMSKICNLISHGYGLDKEMCELILTISPMHDIGKIGIPDNILLKPGKLNTEELKIIRNHCIIGANIIGKSKSEPLKSAYTAAMTHHEKWDGTGYPNGLKGENIPLIGRIIAAADVFDALTSKRPYKKAWDYEKALKYIKSQNGIHFDPQIIEAFFTKRKDILDIIKKYSD